MYILKTVLYHLHNLLPHLKLKLRTLILTSFPVFLLFPSSGEEVNNVAASITPGDGKKRDPRIQVALNLSILNYLEQH